MFIVETDPTDAEPAVVHGPFDTDEDAVTWAGRTLAPGTWHLALCSPRYGHDGIYEAKGIPTERHN